MTVQELQDRLKLYSPDDEVYIEIFKREVSSDSVVVARSLDVGTNTDRHGIPLLVIRTEV